MRTNKEFLDSLRSPLSRFYLYDFHVHSPGSYDMCEGDRYESLSDEEKKYLTKLKSIPADIAHYDEEITKTFPIDQYYDLLVKRKNEVAESQGISDSANWSIIAITDHNVANYSCELSKHAWCNKKSGKLIILPGIELSICFKIDNEKDECNIHVLCIYQPNTNAGDIRLSIANASDSSWEFGKEIKIEHVDSFISNLRNHDTYPAICIAAHVGSSKGVQNELNKNLLGRLDAEIARTEGEILRAVKSEEDDLKDILNDLIKKRDNSDVNEEVLKIIGSCGFDALQVRGKEDEKHYRRLHRFMKNQGRAVPIICSDAHKIQKLFINEDNSPFLKISDISSLNDKKLFSQIRDKALRFGETRTTYKTPGEVITWIEGIDIIPDSSDASKFWPLKTNDDVPEEIYFDLSFSRNLNCLIGGRGSGKSAMLDSIAFACNFDEIETAKKSDFEGEDWYKRSCSTLNGCIIRICWKSIGLPEFKLLKKQSLFVDRYFDPNGKYQRSKYSDIDGKEVLPSSIILPDISLFRIHDIESASEPERLRQLFDEICGDEINNLNEDIDIQLEELRKNREKLVSLSDEIELLTEEEAPLREYIRRKKQFLEVNKKEVKEKYKAIDDAIFAVNLVKKSMDEWSEIESSIFYDEIEDEIEVFFDSLGEKIYEDEKIKPNCEFIQKIIETGKDEENRSKPVNDIIKKTKKAFEDISNELKKAHTKIDGKRRTAQDDLVAEGLPSGSADREAKKEALDEANKDLEKYRKLICEWDEKYAIRIELHEKLVNDCKIRTDLRIQTAEDLTANLSRDLDSNILIIEADAQPVADKTEYIDWLDREFSTSLRTHRLKRIDELINKGITTSDLRNLFLSTSDFSSSMLIVNKDKVSSGKIPSTDADLIFDNCVGRIKLPVESVEVEENKEGIKFIEDLPEEIVNGLWGFPVLEDESLQVDSIFELDEIVFDDIPIVRLNDRPKDEGSTSRNLEDLSPGQRCSAILPILLLNGENPIIIDQPEDNLDNRLIRQVIVNILSSMKLKRQVIVATHNPNLPVLGDAEQSIILRAVGEKQCVIDANGDLDSSEVVQYITDIMEGGREAFQYRHTIYLSHWEGQIS